MQLTSTVRHCEGNSPKQSRILITNGLLRYARNDDVSSGGWSIRAKKSFEEKFSFFGNKNSIFLKYKFANSKCLAICCEKSC